jgi:hypothetical protein
MVLLEQLAGLPQVVLDEGNWQVLAWPSHLPTQAALPAQALREGVPAVRGSPVINRHVPGEPVSLQEAH